MTEREAPSSTFPAQKTARGFASWLPRLPKGVSFAVKLLVAALAVAFVIRKVPFHSAFMTLRHCDFMLVGFSVLLQYAVAVISAFRWKILFRHPELSFWKYLYFVFLGLFFNFFLPSSAAAEAVKVLAFGRKYGSTQENIGIALFSKIVGFGTQVLLGGIGLAVFARELQGKGFFARMHMDQRVFLAAILLPALAGGIAWWLRARWQKQIWFRTILEIARNRKLCLQTALLTVALQLLSILSSYCLFLSLYPQTHFWHVTLFTTIILAVLTLPFGFGGVGIREYLNLLLFSDIGGIPPDIVFAVNMVGYLPLIVTALTGCAWMAFRKYKSLN